MILNAKAFIEGPDNLLPDRTFSEADLDGDLILLLESAATVCCSWITWFDETFDTSLARAAREP